MAWIYLDDHLDEHPKFVGLSSRAAWLYVRGLMYCSRHLTAGHIPKGSISAAYDQRTYSKLTAELQHAGLWERMEDGSNYVHDYATWNAAQLVRRQKAKSAAQARWKAKYDDARSNAPSNAQPHANEHGPEQCSSDALEPKNQRTKEQQHVSGQLTSVPDQRRELLLQLANQAADRAQPANRPAYLAVTLRAMHQEHSGLNLQELEAMLNQPAPKPKDPPEAARRDYDHERPKCQTCNGSNWMPAPDNTWQRCTHNQTEDQHPF